MKTKCPRCGQQATVTFSRRGTERIHTHKRSDGTRCRGEWSAAKTDQATRPTYSLLEPPFKSENHKLQHALEGCGCRMNEIFNCVICSKALDGARDYVDTCGAVCYRKLLSAQREFQASFRDDDNYDEDGSPLDADNDPDA